MAHTLYLKAVEDVSVGHLFSGNSASESIRDYNFIKPSTIHTSEIDASTNTSVTATSIFKLGLLEDIRLKDINIKNVAFFCRHTKGSNITSTCGVSMSVNGSQIYTNSAVGSAVEIEISSLVDILNSSFQSNTVPEILMTLTSTATASASVTESSLESASIIEAYLVVDYDFINVFCFRPSADISLQHESSLTAGYLAICEEILDGDSTLIQSLGQPGEHTEVSEFRLSGTVPSEKIKIVGLYAIVSSQNANGSVDRNTCTLTIGDKSQTAEFLPTAAGTGDSYNVSACEFDELLDLVNAYIKANGVGSFPDATISITTSTNSPENSKGTYPYTKISQVYLEVVYQRESGLNIYSKSSGGWVQSQSVYQKQSGTWVEITEDECIEILQGNLVIMGGM